MNQFSTKQEKKVTIQSYQPTALSMLTLLKEHADSTDTELHEWTVEIEKKSNEMSNFSSLPQNRWRWEVTLTRSIK